MANWLPGIGQSLISNLIWWLLAVVLGGLAVLLTYLTPPVREYAPLSYLLTALIVLVLAAILANYAVSAWRRYKPLTDAPRQTLPELDYTEVDQVRGELAEKVDQIFLRIGTVDRDLRNELDGLREQLKALEEKARAVIQDYQTVLGRLAKADERADAASARIELQITQTARDFEFTRREEAKLADDIKSSEGTLRESINALVAKADLAALATEIEKVGDELFLPLKSGERYDRERWGSWQSIHSHWERTVTEWADKARWYGKNVKADIFRVEDREYDDTNWGVDDAQFPDADAVRRYKRHRIIQGHWRAMRHVVDPNVLAVAYGAISEKECHGGKHHQ